MGEIEWTDAEREALQRICMGTVSDAFAADAELRAHVEARVRQAKAEALREAADKDAEVVNVHAGGGNLVAGRRVVTVDVLRDRADAEEAGR